jgi:RimJ/RimL family protein N-acetyltransferase
LVEAISTVRSQVASRLVSDPDRVFELVSRYTRIHGVEDQKGVGLEIGGDLVAGVVYQQYNGSNVWMHIAIVPERRVTFEFVWYVFHYPFIELGCKRVGASVDMSNAASRRICERVGFLEEARLRGAGSDGGDVVLYVMWKEGCRYV